MADSVNHSNQKSPRIVMLLANDFTHDTRVYKQARSLIEWGCEVHVVAMARPVLPESEVCDGIHVHRVPTNQRRFHHVLEAALLWWSRSLLRRNICRADTVRMDAADAVDPVDHCGAPSADSPALSNGVVEHSADKSEELQPSRPDRPLNRSLAARAYRRGKVYVGRAKLRVRRVGRWLVHLVEQAVSVLIAVLSTLWSIGRTTSRRGIAATARLNGSVSGRLRRWTPGALRLLAINHRFAAEALRLQPDVIVAHDLNMLLAAMMTRRLDGKPVLYDSHELYLERNIGDKNRFTDKLVWWPVERLFIRRCAAVMTVAEGICDHLARQYEIPRPALVRNVQPYEPPAPRSRLLSDELGIDHERPIVLYPGAITINRGLEQMIDSSVHLHNAAYVVMGYAGNPAYLESLKKRAEAIGQLGRSVFFRDAVPIEDVIRYTASADLGIVPTQNVCLSYQFESSNKIFHCLMAGVPLVMSDHIEKRHIATTYDVGELFDETDPRAIAAAVNDLLADRPRLEHLRRNCLRAARQLNWEHEEHVLRSVYAQVLGTRARPVPAPRIPDQTCERSAMPIPETGGVHEHSTETV